MQIQGMKTSLHYIGVRHDVALLTVIGYVDTTTCKELAHQVRELMDQNYLQIVVDLGGVGYISSAGWGVFVGEIKNIRERGGDLKIVQMTAEVIEVFEMLEFNRILNHYETIEEALNEFDIIRGLDICVSKPAAEGRVSPIVEQYPTSIGTRKRGRSRDAVVSARIEKSELPIVEKIKQIVVEAPPDGAMSIRAKLRTDTYGHVNVSWFTVRKILKDLNLETKVKRFRFYRSR
ncbi:STAS domain-containing protein [bacterium]|nr:STAS domain-containing protein [bacterium]